jgi:hypothetical protein
MSVIFLNPYRFQQAGYAANATHFNAAEPAYLSRATALSGVVDSKRCLLSFWIKMTADDATDRRILYDKFGYFQLTRTSANKVRLVLLSPEVVDILDVSSTAATITIGGWHHVAIAIDTSDSSKCVVAIDGGVGTSVALSSDVAAKFTQGNWRISWPSTSVGISADVAEFFFAPDQWLDLSVAANVAKFRDSATGKPVSLGADGSLPTGTAPAVYLKNPYSSFGTNSGTGGDFTVNGTLTEATPP